MVGSVEDSIRDHEGRIGNLEDEKQIDKIERADFKERLDRHSGKLESVFLAMQGFIDKIVVVGDKLGSIITRIEKLEDRFGTHIEESKFWRSFIMNTAWGTGIAIIIQVVAFSCVFGSLRSEVTSAIKQICRNTDVIDNKILPKVYKSDAFSN